MDKLCCITRLDSLVLFLFTRKINPDDMIIVLQSENKTGRPICSAP
jgi:hypothetical protein